ncbi:site-specific integrase [Aquabacterium sp.]|uniref:site-specific integrase n=1 Tax=Aquabacterium sp. TaxID=1872578 RepID=UPI003D6D746A
MTIDERDRVLAHFKKKYDLRVWAYFAWMFFTGMRPEEAIALRWSDVDFGRQEVLVQRVRTFRGCERDGSKTDDQRTVDLVPEALEALTAMKQYTFMKRTEREGDDDTACDIFENSVTQRTWHDERSQRDHYWAPTLRALGIRRRRAYATRHTYCTTALMGRVNPAYIAAQAGHSVKMLLEVYARGIPGNDNGAERAVMAAAMARRSGPTSSPGGSG